MFAALDDHGSTADILWMPAHTGPSHIGIATLSDGSLMTRIDQSANDLADKLAKSAALEFRVPLQVRSRIAADQVLACQLAMWIGQATAMASAYPSPDGKLVRDSRPAPRASTVDVPNPPLVSRTRLAPVTPAARWAAKLRVCIGADDYASHETHRVRVTGSVTWCGRCGAYASMRGRGMAKPCRGAPSAVATARWALTRHSPATSRPRTVRTLRSRVAQATGCSASTRCKRTVRGAALRLFALRSGFHPVSGMPLLSLLHAAAPPPHPGLPPTGSASPAAVRFAALRARVRAREVGAMGIEWPCGVGVLPAAAVQRPSAAEKLAALRARVTAKELCRRAGAELPAACCRPAAAVASAALAPCSGGMRRLAGVQPVDRPAALRTRLAAKEVSLWG